MSRATWKRTERSIAGIIGGERVPVSGRQRGDQPDVRHAGGRNAKNARPARCVKNVQLSRKETTRCTLVCMRLV